MNTAITASQIQREPGPPRQTVVATGGRASDGWLLQEVTRRRSGRGVSNLDVMTLTKLLREAERIMANTNLLFRDATGQSNMPPAWSRVKMAKRPKMRPKTAASTIEGPR